MARNESHFFSKLYMFRNVFSFNSVKMDNWEKNYTDRGLGVSNERVDQRFKTS